MNTQKLRAYHAIPVMLGALVFAATPALAGPVEGDRTNAVATFTSHDPAGCISTETSVFVRKDGARKERLELRILQVNDCTGVGILDARANRSIPNGSFRISPDRGSASLNLTTAVVDQFSSTEFPMSIVLQWKAEGAGATAKRLDEPTALGKFKRNLKPVQRTVRLSDASGTLYFKQSGMTLKSADSAWIDHTSSISQ